MTVICWDAQRSVLYADTARTTSRRGQERVVTHNSTKIHDLTDLSFPGERYLVAARSGRIRVARGIVSLIRQYGIDLAAEKLEDAHTVQQHMDIDDAWNGSARVLVVTDQRVVMVNYRGLIEKASETEPTFMGSGAIHCEVFTQMGLSYEDAILLTSTVKPGVGPLMVRVELDRAEGRIKEKTLIRPKNKTEFRKSISLALGRLRVKTPELPTTAPRRLLSGL